MSSSVDYSNNVMNIESSVTQTVSGSARESSGSSQLLVGLIHQF